MLQTGENESILLTTHACSWSWGRDTDTGHWCRWLRWTQGHPGTNSHIWDLGQSSSI